MLVALMVSLLVMCVDIFFVNREQVDPFVGCIIKPRKVIDSEYIDLDLGTVDLFDAEFLLHDSLLILFVCRTLHGNIRKL